MCYCLWRVLIYFNGAFEYKIIWVNNFFCECRYVFLSPAQWSDTCNNQEDGVGLFFSIFYLTILLFSDLIHTAFIFNFWIFIFPVRFKFAWNHFVPLKQSPCSNLIIHVCHRKYVNDVNYIHEQILFYCIKIHKITLFMIMK